MDIEKIIKLYEGGTKAWDEYYEGRDDEEAKNYFVNRMTEREFISKMTHGEFVSQAPLIKTPQ